MENQSSLRLWPGIAAAVLLVLAAFVLPEVVPGTGGTAVLAGVVAALIVLLWWLFFSRAPWRDRLIAIAGLAVALFVVSRLSDESIRNGMMGLMPAMFGLPVLSLGLVAWAALSRHLRSATWRRSLPAVLALACVPILLLRTNGVAGDGSSDFAWRWTPTAEQQLLARTRDLPLAPAAPAVSEPAPVTEPAGESTPPAAADAAPEAAPSSEEVEAVPAATPESAARIDWPGFRGAERDGVIRAAHVDTNWTASPPVEVWRRPIGPGWSSFAVDEERIYTQEQRGEHEIVACYSLATGEPIWAQQDEARFWESNGGAGPRGTPALSGGRVYTFGATGILNALDARTGARIWSHNAAEEHGVATPGWGFASSPLVVDDLVIVAVSGVLAAYDRATGELRWVNRAEGGGGYSSPQRVTIDGVEQVLLMAGGGLRSVAPRDGSLLWSHDWPGSPIVQPARIAGNDLLISTSGMSGALGVRRLSVSRTGDAWRVDEAWSSNGLKPYFNDLVVHEGHVYGFDGFILASVDLSDGSRNWKGGRYGNGQLVLLADEDVLFVLSEEGELALVSATPDKFTELARVPGIEGKTWNHPVLVGDMLLVRNGQEMAAFRLALAR